MKLRCPHCRKEFKADAAHAVRCPCCGKTLLTQAFKSTLKAPPGKNERPPHARPASPMSFVMGTPFRIAVVVLIMLFIGNILVQRGRQGPPDTLRHNLALARDNLLSLRIALHRLRQDTGRLPTTREGLAALVHNPDMPGWNGPYIFELKPDPWGNSFQYRNDGQLQLFSKGPDGIAATSDDIRVDDTTIDLPRNDRIYSPPINVQPRPGQKPDAP